AGLRRADEPVVRYAEPLPHGLEVRRDVVDELLWRHAAIVRRLGHFLAVLIETGEKMHVVAAQAMIPRDGVGSDLLVRVANVRFAVRVIDRGGEVEPAHLRVPRRAIRLRLGIAAAAMSRAIAATAAPTASAVRLALAARRFGRALARGRFRVIRLDAGRTVQLFTRVFDRGVVTDHVVVDDGCRREGRHTRHRERRTGGVRLFAQFGERDGAQLSVRTAQRDALAEDVVGDQLLFAAGRVDETTFLGKALAAVHVELVLVAEAAHE